MVNTKDAKDRKGLGYCFILLLLALLSACNAPQTLAPDQAHGLAISAWQRGWHGVWALNWQESPIVGPIIFEAWQTEAGQQRRYEILESDVPALVGLTYINDGEMAIHFNRLEPTAPAATGGPNLPFSPLSDAFDKITALLAKTPQSAQRQAIDLPQGPGLQLTLTYPEKQVLTLWLDITNNLIIQANLEAPETHFTLSARSLEGLSNPHPKLFEIPEYTARRPDRF